MKISTNGSGHMTKMVAMPIYGDNPKKSPDTEGQGPCNLVYCIGYVVSTMFVEMMILC